MNPMAPEDEDSSYRWLPPRKPPVEHPSPGPAPVPPWMQMPTRRANRDAFVISLAIGAAFWLFDYLITAERSVHNSAYAAGASMGAALIAALPVAFAAWSSAARWPLWRYCALIVGIGLGLMLLHSVSNSVSASGTARERASDAGPAESALDVHHTVDVPALVGPWVRDDSAATQVRVQQAEEQVQRGLGAEGATPDVAFYRNGDQQALLLVLTGQPGGRFDEETSASPARAVVDELAGAGVEQRTVAEPGPLGGALGCGPSTTNEQLYVCTWAERGMLGSVSFVDTPITADAAAETTRGFRAATEH